MQGKKNKPCKGKRARYRKFVSRIEKEVAANPNIEIAEMDYPFFVKEDTKLFTKLTGRLQRLKDDCLQAGRPITPPGERRNRERAAKAGAKRLVSPGLPAGPRAKRHAAPSDAPGPSTGALAGPSSSGAASSSWQGQDPRAPAVRGPQ